jgi:DNA-directed RNA polymerase beta' subunit
LKFREVIRGQRRCSATSLQKINFLIANKSIVKTMMNNRNNNSKDKNPVKRFNKISIGLASPESILKESRGEVLKPETIIVSIVHHSFYY